MPRRVKSKFIRDCWYGIGLQERFQIGSLDEQPTPNFLRWELPLSDIEANRGRAKAGNFHCLLDADKSLICRCSASPLTGIDVQSPPNGIFDNGLNDVSKGFRERVV